VVFLSTGILPSVGGPFESVSGLARGLAADESTDVTVLGCSSSGGGWEEHRHRWGESRLVVFEGDPATRLTSAIRYLSRRLDARSVDIVHASGLWDETTVLAANAFSCSTVPVVWSIRGMLEPWAINHHPVRKRMAWLAGQGRALRQAAVIHATAPAEAASCRAAGLRQPIAVIPNGIEMSPLSSDGASRGQTSARRCVYLGRLHPKKGLANLIEAWRRCRTNGWELEIAGPCEDGHAAMLSGMVERHSLKNVRVTGPRYGEDRRRFLEDCEVFICPSFSENFGNAIAEAMERGKPVITTTGSPWGVLAEEQLGWWVEPRVDHLRGAIGEALESSPERLHEMGLRGRQYVEKHLSWAGVVGPTLAVYQWLLGGPRPDCIDTQADVTK
jgi:glycosyltransferase involved in cell wall biosynthesis